MMRGIRRLVVCTAVTGLLAAGAVGASLEVAHADSEVDYCLGTSSNNYDCTVTGTFDSASAVTINVSDDATTSNGDAVLEEVTVDVTALSCTDNSGTASEPASSAEGYTPVSDDVTPLPVTADGQCTATATVSLPSSETSTSGFTPSEFTATLDYTPSSSATASPTPTPTSTASPVHPVKGYDGKCVDDNGNSSANRAKIQIWGCSGTDQAENWKYSNDEFVHSGKCLNDQGDGGNRSHVILYSCNGGSNEKWIELANGELVLKAHNENLCLDDPRSSTKNGTQLIVYTCKDSANQKWSLP
jgi:hypothetical protein